MKVKNIAFSGFMAAILMGAVATPADAVTVASREYVDAREGAILKTVGDTYLTTEVAENTYVKEGDVTNAITNAVTDNAALSGALGGKEDKDNKVGAITKEQLDAMTASDKANKYASIEAAEDIAEISAAKINEVGGEVLELSNQVSANTTAISTLNGDATTKGSVAKQIADSISELNLAGTYEEKGTAQGLIDDLTGETGQVGINTAAIATNTQSIADNAGAIAQNAQDIADNAADIAKKADAATTLAGYGITDAYTSAQTDSAITTEIETLDSEGRAEAGSVLSGVTMVDGKITQVQQVALGKLATANVPAECVNDSGTMCVLAVKPNSQVEGGFEYSWTAITEPTPQNP